MSTSRAARENLGGFRDRVPAGVPTGGQFAHRFRPESRLRLVPGPAQPDPDTRAVDLGITVEDYATFERLDRALIASGFRGTAALSALEKMTYGRICDAVDAHARTRGDHAHLPACPACDRAWGTGWQCRACTDGYGDPLPLRMRADATLRAEDTRRDRRPYWAR